MCLRMCSEIVYLWSLFEKLKIEMKETALYDDELMNEWTLIGSFDQPKSALATKPLLSSTK